MLLFVFVFFKNCFILFFFYIQIVFRKIADVKRERELAETRKNEGLDQISSDHPVRKLISKFRKISQENRAASLNNPNSSTPPTTIVNPSPPSKIQPPGIELNDSPSLTTNVTSAPPQHLQLPSITTTVKTRDKLETISERLETQESQISQITSVNQSPPLQRPPKSSKWKWLKTGSTGPETQSPPPQAKGIIPNIKLPEQQITNPFDSNLTDDDTQGKLIDENERRPSIPLSLFIPRSARYESTKISEDGSDDHVRYY